MSELRQFRLPDVGEGLTEADIVKWHVQPGDTVKVNQIIVEIETAKAVVELPSPYAGVVSGVLVPEGVTVDVGTPIITVEVSTAGGSPAVLAPPVTLQASTSADLVPPLPPEAVASEGVTESGDGSAGSRPERQAVLVGYGVKLGATTRRPRKPAADRGPLRAVSASAGPAHAGESAGGQPAAPESAAGPSTAARPEGAVLAKPPVRKLARDLGVDLSALTGTGPNGSITRDDVQSAGAPAPATADAGAGTLTSAPAGLTRLSSLPREERIPVRGVRKHTAAAMTRSAFTAPHVTMFLQVDMTETVAATNRLKAMPDFADVKVSPLLLVSRALLVAAARHPMINSSWDEDAQEIVVRHYVNLGIAVATDRGLVVPNVKDAHALSLPDLARSLAELAQAARAGKAAPADLAGGTISITNVGVFGVDTGTPILPPGETAILALGQVRDAPWVHEGKLAVRQAGTLAMSFDHRVVDGDLGAAVLRDVGAMLTDPLRMLAWS